MNIKNGDKLIVKKSIANFKKGDVITVSNLKIENDFVSFNYADGYALTVATNHFDDLFDKVPTVTQEMIDEIMYNSNITVQTVFGKCTVVACMLPNGFVIVESSACVDPDNYDKNMGIEICLDKIENKVWELEGYRLQEELYCQNYEDNGNSGCPYGDSVDCNYCDNDDCDTDEDEDDEDDCEDNVYFCRCCGCH